MTRCRYFRNPMRTVCRRQRQRRSGSTWRPDSPSLLEHATPSERDFEPKLSRNQAKLRGVPELFRGSISHWLEHGQAVSASERSICFVARLDLSSGSLLRVALTEQWGSGHVDVWGHPQELLALVVAVGRERKRP